MNRHKRCPLDIREQAARLVLLTWNIRISQTSNAELTRFNSSSFNPEASDEPLGDTTHAHRPRKRPTARHPL